MGHAEYVWQGPPYGCTRPMGRVLNMFGMGGHMAAADLWSVCLICLGMGRPMGRVLNLIGNGSPSGCGRPMGRVPDMFGMGRPMAAAALWGV